MSRKSVAAELRFWPKVAKAGADDCWKWLGCTDSLGYGVFWMGEKRIRAHTALFMLEHGRPPKNGSVVRHLCGNKLCANPRHIAEGSHRQNWEDAVRHGTAHLVKPEGLENHPHAVFSNDDVMSMRALANSGHRVVDIARATGRKYSTVWAAVRGQNYAALHNKKNKNNGANEEANR